MKRMKQFLWAALVLLTLAFGLARFHPERQPLARAPLPDGTELRVEAVTYGTSGFTV
jgi:hypothetical protein